MKSIKIFALILCIATLLSLPLGFSFADEEKEITVIACSDFQNKSGNVDGAINMNAILSKIKNSGVTKADGFFCCGDYDYDTYGEITCTEEGIAHIKNSVGEMVDEENMVFVQGNHDAPVYANVGLSPSGNNDTDNYGVFVIHNTDYMWKNDDEGRIKLTAQNLINYLNEKLEAGYDKPVFVLSHVPLHYTMRTKQNGDAKFACYIFDALNDAANKGLNIIFMYGHDHSNGWDDYLGGSSVYLKKGDKILIAKKSTTAKEYKTLNFTYLNAGFVGYYNNQNGADDALTMTVFKVKGDEVTVERYSKNGIHNLKSKGVTNAYKGETGYDPDTTVYTSPQSITLTSVSDKTPVKDILSLEHSAKRFDRINKLTQLESGEEYLLVYNSSQDYIMLPKVVSKSDSDGTRTGFDLEKTDLFGDSVAYADLGNGYTWTFTKVDGGWLLGNGKGYAHFEKSSDQKIKATLEKDGDVVVIDGSLGEFTFTTDLCAFDYNDRVLVNGYDGTPSDFYIYKYSGYDLKISKGEAFKNETLTDAAKSGDEVKIIASKAPEGTVFDKWVVIKGDVTFDDASSPEAKFTMTGSQVEIEATYKAVKTEPIKEPRGDIFGTVVTVSIGVVAVIALATVLAIVLKKKKSKS